MDPRIQHPIPPFLRATVILFIALFALALVGLALDPSQITGAPAWLKPAKFALSTAIYVATVAWLARWTTAWPRLVRALTHGIALVLVVEDAIIFLQAWRGTTSHFNTSTPLDSALFSVMGAAIALLWAASAVLAAALFRSQFADASWGAALRWGMALSVAGSAIGGLMVQPTPTQLEILKAGQSRPAALGAHTVGAADGGPGLAGVGWSTAAGDLRVPHFLGLHAVQILPLSVLLFRKRGFLLHESFVYSLAASYAGLTSILLWQALRAEPLIHPSPPVLQTLAVWAVLSVGALALAGGRRVGREQVA